MKATPNDEHIAKVSEIKNALNEAFCDLMGIPSLPEALVYPPGRVNAAAKVIVVMRIATNEVLVVYV